jgi:hypothetical protein
LRVATTRWRRRGRGKVARRSRRRRDNRGDATTSWQTRGKREGRHTRKTGGEASADKRRQIAERTRGGGGLQHDVRRCNNQPEAPAEHPNPPPPPSPPAGMAAPLARSLAMAAAATSPRHPRVRHRQNPRVHRRRRRPPCIAAVVAPIGRSARPSGGSGARCEAAAAAAIGAAAGATRS